MVQISEPGNALHKSVGEKNEACLHGTPAGILCDRTRPVLAEIPSGSFCVDSLAPAAKWILDYYSQEIAGLPDSGIPTSSDISDLYSSWENIAPIMTTKWNQSAPYNNACPTIGSHHCYTGCVATAMAQVVRSNGFAHPSGYKSYVPPKVNKTVSFDYSSASFDPSLMPDICGPNTPAGQSEAVALLMLACGVSVSMDYGTDESGAYTDEVANALIKYFGYDSGTRFYSRDRFNTAQWEEFVYTELQLGRPLVYSGLGGSKGHAFVVDGYKCPGLFHVNWGWGGLSDGYFALTALNPSKQGIGSSGQGGYNYVQGAIAALRPGDAPGKSFLSMAGSLKHVGPGKYDVYFQSL